METRYHNDTNHDEKMLYLTCSGLISSYSLHGIYRQNWMIVGGANLILALVTFIINLITLIALRKIKDKNTITNCIFASLCASDMFTGLLGQPFFGAFYITVFYEKRYCGLLFLTIGSGCFFVLVSFLCILEIHIERYLGVFYPFHHNKIKMDILLIKKMIAVGWILVAILILICFFTPQLIMSTVIAAVLFPVGFILCFYVQVKTVGQVRRLRRCHRNNIVPQLDDTKTRKHRHFDQVELRASRLAGLILVAFTICYTPNLIVYIWIDLEKRYDVLVAVKSWTETLVMANSILNPLLFNLKKKDVREIVVSSLCMLKPCSTVTSE